MTKKRPLGTITLLVAMTVLFNLLPYGTLNAVPPAPWEGDDLIGKPAPEYTFNDLDGKAHTLSLLKGRAVLLNFWGSYCTPCKEEFPSMNELYRKLKDKGFTVVAISVGDTKSGILDFLKKVPVDFTILLAPDRQFAKEHYKVFSLPSTFLINKEGIVVRRYLGEINWMEDSVVGEIKSHL